MIARRECTADFGLDPIPSALTADQKAEVRRMRDDEHRHVSEIARLFKVSERTVRRA